MQDIHEVYRSEITESDPQAGIIRTVDKDEYKIGMVKVIDDIGGVAVRTVTPNVPYSGTEDPFVIVVYSPSRTRTELPA